ncbi:hypothetical protein DPMN_113545 [Dreissena polymorpha]|uniref:Uncharacterized protein n=1 Tax=Dreissena polymorpha TaxID=45954 RepID=A0A9D4KIU5_DREPO|nr:hypothetical protein DPMN_113545 [Dreissena polymorpha]
MEAYYKAEQKHLASSQVLTTSSTEGDSQIKHQNDFKSLQSAIQNNKTSFVSGNDKVIVPRGRFNLGIRAQIDHAITSGHLDGTHGALMFPCIIIVKGQIRMRHIK